MRFDASPVRTASQETPGLTSPNDAEAAILSILLLAIYCNSERSEQHEWQRPRAGYALD